jgi:small subunit ribosomal protein S6
MNKYETLFLIKPDLQDDQVQAVLDRLQSHIEGSQGKLAVIEHWGNRALAYPVQYRGEKLRRGYYVLLTYGGDGRTVDEVERNIKILDQTFRYLTVKLEDAIDPAALGEEVQVTRRAEHGGRRHGLAAREGEEAAAPAPEQAAPAAAQQAPAVAEHEPEAAASADEAEAPAEETAAQTADDAGALEPGDKEE